MGDDSLSRHHRKRLAQWRRAEGMMTQEQRMRLARWRRLETQRVFDQVLGEKPEPVWCVVANVVAEYRYGPGGKETRRGTRHFMPGAKVYCLPPRWGDGYEKIMVIGRHRGSHRYISIVMRSDRLTNWRVQMVYSPHVIREMIGAWYRFWDHHQPMPPSAQEVEAFHQSRSAWDGSPESKQQADSIVAFMRERRLLAHLQAQWDEDEADNDPPSSDQTNQPAE